MEGAAAKAAGPAEEGSAMERAAPWVKGPAELCYRAPRVEGLGEAEEWSVVEWRATEGKV